MSRRYPPGSFVVMPQAAIYDPRLTLNDLRVLMLLQDHASGFDDLMFPGLRRMADDLGIDKRTVRRTLRRLEHDGYIETIPRTKPGRGKTTSHYRVLFESRGGTAALSATAEGAADGTREGVGGKPRGPPGKAEGAPRWPVIDHPPGDQNSAEHHARARETAGAVPGRSLTPAGLAAGHDSGRGSMSAAASGGALEARQDHEQWIEINPRHHALARCIDAVNEREGEPDDDGADRAVLVLANHCPAAADVVGRQIEAHLLGLPQWRVVTADDLRGITAHQLGTAGGLAMQLVAHRTQRREDIGPMLQYVARVMSEEAWDDNCDLATRVSRVLARLDAPMRNGHDQQQEEPMGDGLIELRKRFGDVQVQQWRKMCRGSVTPSDIDAWVIDSVEHMRRHVHDPTASDAYKITLVVSVKLEPFIDGRLSADGRRLKAMIQGGA